MIHKRGAHLLWLIGLIATLVCLTGCAPDGSSNTQSRPARPQESSAASPTPSPEEYIRVRKEGWAIPDLAQCKVDSPRRKNESDKKELKKVYLTWYEPKEEISVIEHPLGGMPCPSEKAKKLRIRNIAVYDVGKRRFCVTVWTTRVPCVGESALLSVSPISYYDEDGDGVFETLDASESAIDSPSHIPKWVTAKR